VQSHEKELTPREAVVSTSAATSAFTDVGSGNDGVAKSQQAAQLIKDALETVQNESRAAALFESKVAELRTRAALVEKTGKRIALEASEKASNATAYELLSDATRLQAQARDAEIKAAESFASAKAFALDAAMYETLAKQAGLDLGVSKSSSITSPAASAAAAAA
jgi:hypothetical protein